MDAIDFAVREVGITSFADLDAGATYGEHALYAMDRPACERALADARTARGRGQLLDVIEHAAERPGLRVVDGDALDRDTIAEIGEVDAVFLFNVLLHTVAPDWDRVLEIYAAATSCFVIANPQWRVGAETVRLIELGRDRYLETVPSSAANSDLFERLDEWSSAEQRPRDSRTVWQWGITDTDLKAKLEELGFGVDSNAATGTSPEPRRSRARRSCSAAAPLGTTRGRPRAISMSFRRSLATAEHERDELRRRADDLERTLEDMVESSSWKLTKPLRAAKRPFRRRR